MKRMLFRLIPILLAVVIPFATGAGLDQPALAGLVQPVSDTTVATPNWGGYAAGTTGPYTNVTGHWTQPAIPCGPGQTSYSAYWVGLDGFKSRTVEQTGTEADCVNGTPRYVAWYEFYPKGAHEFVSIAAGDTIQASVLFDRGSFTATLDVNGTPHVAKAKVPSAPRSSAEAIVEAPSSNHGPFGSLPLADFGTVSLTGVTVDGGTLAAASPDELVMESGTTVKAQPSAIGGDAESFSVSWEHP